MAHLVVNNSEITGNIADTTFDDGLGGGITNEAVDGGYAEVMIENSIVSGNEGDEGGGGLHNIGYPKGQANLTINNTIIFGNDSNSGSGIYNRPNGNLTISNSTVANNGRGAALAGILNLGRATIDSTIISGNYGRGIYTEALVTGTVYLTVSNSIISDHDDGNGGGIYVYADGAEAEVSVVNSTVSGNSANSVEGGGGIGAYSNSGTINVGIDNSTFSDNQATANSDFSGGGPSGLQLFGGM